MRDEHVCRGQVMDYLFRTRVARQTPGHCQDNSGRQGHRSRQGCLDNPTELWQPCHVASLRGSLGKHAEWDQINFWIIKGRRKRTERGSGGFSGVPWSMFLSALYGTFNPAFGLRSGKRSRLVTRLRKLFKDTTLEYVTSSTVESGQHHPEQERAGLFWTFGKACMSSLYRFFTDFDIYWIRECGTLK